MNVPKEQVLQYLMDKYRHLCHARKNASSPISNDDAMTIGCLEADFIMLSTLAGYDSGALMSLFKEQLKALA